MLDIGFYGENGEVEVMRNVVVSGETTEVLLSVQFKIAAVFLNEDEFAYSKIAFDA